MRRIRTDKKQTVTRWRSYTFGEDPNVEQNIIGAWWISGVENRETQREQTFEGEKGRI